ncbi:MAG: hypothetical protein HYU66_13375 [Armatimonadetes bacterium]|nr:hypothetical protein [Armatimonadota bacterium]
MNVDDAVHAVRKGLEVWTLQNLCDGAILLTFVVLAMVAGRGYLEGLRRRLTLRVAAEVWDVATDMVVDLCLFGIVLVGLFVTNMDIFADIKVALPWVPLAFVLAGVALMLRLFHGGREVGSRGWWLVLAVLGTACAACWFGFTFVMEGAGEEYLQGHPSAFWEGLAMAKSNANPTLCMATFRWAAPAFVLLLGWGVTAGVARTLRGNGRVKGGPDEQPAADAA